MKVRWSPSAYRNLREIHAFIALDNLPAADVLVERVEDAVLMLAQHPEAGRVGRVSGTRELIVPGTSYIVVYGARSSRVEILSVLQAARNWPNRF